MKNDNTIIRVEKRERYVVLDKHFLEEDDRLSWKATAILAYLLAKPDGWEIRVADLIKRKQDGRDSVRSGLRELIQARCLSLLSMDVLRLGRSERLVVKKTSMRT